jgi:cytochrome d ubiquinol oxidase subunit I
MMFEQQPMKMAAAEALCSTETGAGFSIFAVGDVQNNCDVKQITIPGLTSFLATGDVNSTVKGVKELQAEYTANYGDGSYVPMLPVTYWNFRLMIGFGAFSALLAIAGLWLTRRGHTPTSARFGKLTLIALPMPFLASATGWIFTEMGRQPWIVAPNPTGDATIRLKTQTAVSPYLDTPSVAISLVVFTLLYGVLAVVWYQLMHRYTLEGAPQVTASTSPDGQDDEDAPLAFAY